MYVAQRGLAPIDLKFPTGSAKPPGQGKLSFTGRRAFLIGINMGHFNDPDSERPNDHAGLSRMHKLSAIMDILGANEAPPDPDARRVKILIPTGNGEADSESTEAAGTV